MNEDTVTIIDIVAPEDGRIDQVLGNAEHTPSRTRIKELLLEGAVTLNGIVVTSPSRKIMAGDKLVMHVPAPQDATPKPQDLQLDIVYEDEDLLVVNKPAGMAVHPAPGTPDGTLVNGLLHACGDSLSGIGGVRRPGIVHRIDKDTSGLLVVAKNDFSHQHLSELFFHHDIHRRYDALCMGIPSLKPEITWTDEDGGIVVDAPIGRNKHNRVAMAVHQDGKPAQTKLQPQKIWRSANGYALVSLLSCTLTTGRTHQIRVHLQAIGCPMLGDKIYGPTPAQIRHIGGGKTPHLPLPPRQCLHAAELGFTHPRHGEWLSFDAAWPEDFANMIDALDRGGY